MARLMAQANEVPWLVDLTLPAALNVFSLVALNAHTGMQLCRSRRMFVPTSPAWLASATQSSKHGPRHHPTLAPCCQNLEHASIQKILSGHSGVQRPVVDATTKSPVIRSRLTEAELCSLQRESGQDWAAVGKPRYDESTVKPSWSME